MRVPIECKAGFTLENLEAFCLGKVEMERWGLGRLVLACGAQDRIFTPSDPPYTIETWVPHSFWPVPDSTEDSVTLIWAHPTDCPQPMDWLFFANLLCYVSDVAEKKAGMDLLQIMLTQ